MARVLIVDDDHEIVRLVKAYLEKAGFNVEVSDFANTLGDQKLERFGIYVGERKRVSIEEMIFVGRK